MEITTAVQALGALSQESRLRTFRMLVRTGSEGMAAGEIARKLAIPHNTLSSHLTILVNAGLIQSRRESRSIIYSVNLKARANCSPSSWKTAVRATPISASRCWTA